MNLFKQNYHMFSWMDPIGEYALKLRVHLFNKKTCALLISFLLHIIHGSPCIYGIYKIYM